MTERDRQTDEYLLRVLQPDGWDVGEGGKLLREWLERLEKKSEPVVEGKPEPEVVDVEVDGTGFVFSD